jgi:hypothetical protein
MNEHQFSALDRHAVLTGSDDGFPWFAGAMLALESSEVGGCDLRSSPVATKTPSTKPALMVSEKVFAAIEAGMSWLAGATASSIVGRYREHVAANAKRLTSI